MRTSTHYRNLRQDRVNTYLDYPSRL
jgi:hypothetical protein